MKSWGWFLPSVAVHCAYTCRGCNGFVPLPRLHAEQSLRRHQTLSSVYLRSPPPSPPPSPPFAQSAKPKPQAAAPRRPLSLSSGGGEGGGVEDDPFRPERASISPMVINALVPVLFKEVRVPDMRYDTRAPLRGRLSPPATLAGGRIEQHVKRI
ncbi:unnamed protein product, partial [Laminaria digitata]